MAESQNEKYINAKLQAVERKDTPVIARAHAMENRLPPGQRAVPKLVAMPPITPTYPVIDKTNWRLIISGLVEIPEELNWEQFLQLPQQEYIVDFHCVTHWSKLDQVFTGVDLQNIFQRAKPHKTVKHVIFASYDGYTTNVVYNELQNEVGFVAVTMNGEAIESKYGGPARVVVPHLYGWKSAKFIHEIRFVSEDEPGFWEVRGYSNNAHPWSEERYSDE